MHISLDDKPTASALVGHAIAVRSKSQMDTSMSQTYARAHEGSENALTKDSCALPSPSEDYVIEKGPEHLGQLLSSNALDTLLERCNRVQAKHADDEEASHGQE